MKVAVGRYPCSKKKKKPMKFTLLPNPNSIKSHRALLSSIFFKQNQAKKSLPLHPASDKIPPTTMKAMSFKNSSIIKGLQSSPLIPPKKSMEEFSFPSLPSEQHKLYNLPSLPFPFTPLSDHKSDLLRNYQRSRSFSCLEDLKLRDEISSSEINEEERMDMLWEDFNEELSQFSSEGKARGNNNGFDFSKASDKLDGKKRHGSRELFCVKAVQHRKPGLVLILKVFKKLLFIQKNRKKRTSSIIYQM